MRDTPEDVSVWAVKTALAIRDAVAKLHGELPPDAHLSFGIGIHYGDAILGWIGSEKRLEFTALGDSINTTKRLQENAAKNQILISSIAYERVKDSVDAEPFTPLAVKGKSQPIPVYDIKGLK